METLPAAECPCYILAGGQSSRFGSDKGRVIIQGVPNIIRLVDTLSRLGHAVDVVADGTTRYWDLGIDCLTDSVPNGGPMIGLHTALRHRKQQRGAGWVLAIACDQVLWATEWYSLLATGLETGMWASVFWDGSVQPIPGVYHTDFLPEIELAMLQRQSSIRKILSAQPSHVQLRRSDSNPRQGSFNDPNQLKEVLRQLAE